MVVISGNVYVQAPKGYVKCVLHKRTVHGRDVYYLVETKVLLPELPEAYETLTLPEIISRYGNTAVSEAKGKEG